MLNDLKERAGDHVLKVIIETPKGSQNKYAFDPETGYFKLKDNLPLGCFFPYDFGFIPGTKAPDGDPVDILVLMDAPTFTGCLLECRLIGVLHAVQTEKGKTVENDRLVAVSLQSVTYSPITSLKKMDKNFISQIEQFFIFYASQLGKKVQFRGIKGPKEAMKIIKSFEKK